MSQCSVSQCSMSQCSVSQCSMSQCRVSWCMGSRVGLLKLVVSSNCVHTYYAKVPITTIVLQFFVINDFQRSAIVSSSFLRVRNINLLISRKALRKSCSLLGRLLRRLYLRILQPSPWLCPPSTSLRNMWVPYITPIITWQSNTCIISLFRQSLAAATLMWMVLWRRSFVA